MWCSKISDQAPWIVWVAATRTFSKRNERLIYCALKGFLSGPYEHRPALDEVVQYMAGSPT